MARGFFLPQSGAWAHCSSAMRDEIQKPLAALLLDAPAPWTIERHHTGYPELISAVMDAKGQIVFTLETYTGDGDSIGLSNDEIVALVELVNALATSK